MRARSKIWSFVFSAASVAGFFVACGGGNDRPSDIAAAGVDSGFQEATLRDVLPDTSDSGDAGTCMTKIKDGTETDVDCGGDNACARCELTKACVTASDCASGAQCSNGLCALCTDDATNGDEADRNCGGKSCAACTGGKRCLVNSDCRSASCINQTCACPKDMTIVALARGGAYCIDQAEVTKGQYNKFITANVAVTGQQAPA